MNSDAWSVMREIDPWTVVLIVLGVLFAVREVKELFNDLTKSLTRGQLFSLYLVFYLLYVK